MPSKHANDETDTSTRWMVRCARFDRTGPHDGFVSTPCYALPILMRLRAAATRPPRPLRSEREDLERDRGVATRPLDPREEIDLAEEHPIQFPFRSGIRGSSPRLATNGIAGARWFSQRAAFAASFSLALPRGRPARRPPPRGGGGARSLLSSRPSASTEPQTSSPSSSPRRKPFSRRRDWLGLS
jgi:hypothetical protein